MARGRRGAGSAGRPVPLAPAPELRYNGSMFAAAQLEKACRILESMARTVVMRLDPGHDPEDKFSRALCRVAEQIALAGGDKIRLERIAGPGEERPVLELGNVRYRAVPFGPELEPFLELLVLLSRRSAEAAPTAIPPARLQVLIAPTCPHCPQTVAACVRVAAEHPQVRLEVVDVQYYRDLAGRVTSVPTVVVDGAHTVVGQVSARDLVTLLEQRSEEGYVQRAIASMIASGRLTDAAPLLASPPGQQALCALLRGSTMQQRIGLLIVVEEALAANPHALDGAVPCLLPLLQASDDSLRGDTADLLGRIGAPGAREALTRLLSDGNPDVREVATESLAMLRQPS